MLITFSASIFRKVTRLGKISEENLNGGERVNGGVPTTTHLDCSDVEEENEDGSQNKSHQKALDSTIESTVSIPNTNEDEQATVWEEKAIPSSLPRSNAFENLENIASSDQENITTSDQENIESIEEKAEERQIETNISVTS